jgi:hypothetical protein
MPLLLLLLGEECGRAGPMQALQCLLLQVADKLLWLGGRQHAEARLLLQRLLLEQAWARLLS